MPHRGASIYFLNLIILFPQFSRLLWAEGWNDAPAIRSVFAGLKVLDNVFNTTAARTMRFVLCRWTTVLRLCALSAGLAGLATLGCGMQATLYISAPSNVAAGSPFTVTVTAMVGGNRDRVINSVVHFTTSDGAALFPTYYQFTANDAGSHTFPNRFTLMTAGSQTLTATIVDASALTATANITVSGMKTGTQF